MVIRGWLEVNLRLWEYVFLCLYGWPSPGYSITLSLLTEPCRVLRRLQWASFVSLLFVCLAPWSLARGGSVAHTDLSWRWVSYGRSGDILYGLGGSVTCGRRWRCLLWPETEMARMAEDGDVVYGRRQWCLVWPVMVISCIAADDCRLWYVLMPFSRTCTFIYIGLMALLDRIQLSLSRITISTIKLIKVLMSSHVWIHDIGLPTCGTAAAIAGIWSKFRCTGESSEYFLSCIKKELGQHICQSHLAIKTV